MELPALPVLKAVPNVLQVINVLDAQLAIF